MSAAVEQKVARLLVDGRVAVKSVSQALVLAAVRGAAARTTCGGPKRPGGDAPALAGGSARTSWPWRESRSRAEVRHERACPPHGVIRQASIAGDAARRQKSPRRF
jgi:hypothetical protein